jgi:diguanylate cyclase (GGDEF)-like protein/PAS domain S-box-containing protein
MKAVFKEGRPRRTAESTRTSFSQSDEAGKSRLKILFVEDSPSDVELILHRLQADGMRVEPRRVDDEADFRDALEKFSPDLVVCDFAMPRFSGMAALAILQQGHAQLPCIVVSGTIGEEATVAVLKAGALDLVLKSNLVRLLPAVRGALRHAQSQRDLARLQDELAQNEARFRSLTEMSADWYWEQGTEHRLTGLTGAYLENAMNTATEYSAHRRWEIADYDLSQQEWAEYRAIVDTRKPFRNLEVRRIVQGEARYLELSGEPIIDAAGAFRGYRGVGRDITGRKLSEESLLRFRAALDAALDAIYITDQQTLRILDVNKTACEATGYPREELLSMTVDAILTSFSRPEIQSAYAQAVKNMPEPVTFEAINRRKDGTEYPVEVHRRAVLTNDRYLVVGIARDISARRRAEAALRLRDRAIQASINPIIITNASRPDNPIEFVNPAFERVTGYSAAEVLGRNCRFLQAHDTQQQGLENIRRALREKTEGHAVVRNFRKDGRMFWNKLFIAPVHDDTGEVTHFIGIQTDITESQNYQEQIEHKATHDELTGLPNRNLLRDRFRQAVSFAARHDQAVAVAFLDLDHFKFINDSLGHTAGDQVLRTIARRLTSFLREGDTVARVGGDEFVLVLSSPQGGDRIPEVVRRILTSIAEPLAMEGREFQISSSMGISVSPQDGTDFDTLLKNADIAMYRAKEHGRNTFAFFSSDMNRQISERMSLESALRRALDRQEFRLHYQPRVHLPSGRITGAEALIRWEQPELGDIAPSRFIPLAEDLGLIDVIGNWVLRSACGQAQAWSEAGLPPIVVAVNLSVRQLLQDDIVEQVKAVLRETGLDPRRLELEITESAMMREPQRTGRALAALHELGISTAIDDFGTAYSSLNYLKLFKIDCLKIDQSFVRGLPQDRDDSGITRAIVAMGRSLNLRLIAEGIERDEQHAFLEAIGCEEGQGYLFSKAVAPDEMARLLAIGTLRGESTA